MKRLLMIIPLALFAIGATPAQPPAPIAKLTQTFLDAANSNNAAKFAGLFTDDAVVVDEDSPFTWHGANAGVTWWRSVQRALAKRKSTSLHVTGLPVTEYRADREGDDAYAILPLRIAVSGGGKTHVELGAETFTYHESNGAWKISSATWTTNP